ncbi:ABC transporter substrate-binding protein [Fundicoccus culcitae]|uniref:ABC transporter substrate-binding protein n=1 Tax=Fundicoccus culcitae TaxID=2969821 RepID=A0ABY5P2M6_9LACT|nr:ABC transporter substrate-binding protein [Fundicoccus culcitae]UUX32961.1 ABC transporter substrate-binding protein [Fundicoccus culcitae]
MKKTISRFNVIVAMVLSLVLALVSPVTTLAQDDSAEPIHIGVLQYVEHEALDAVLKGFEDTLNASEFGDRIVWDIQNGNGDQANLQSISEKIARDNDILFAIATPAAQSLAVVETEKPIFIAAVTDPVEAGLVESLEEPNTNVTGTSDMAPIAEQVDLLIRNFPDVENVGLIYNSSEVNSVVLVELAVEELEARGLTTHVGTVTNTNDIAQVMNSLTSQVEAMFMVTDNTIDSSIALVGDMAKEAGIPTIGSSDSVVMTNGLATLSNSYEDYGIQTANMVIRMLTEELDPAEMPVELAENHQVIVNPDFAEALGIDPESIQ